MDVSVDFTGFQRTLTKVKSIKVPLLDNMRVSDVMQHIRERFPQLALRESEVFVVVNNDVSMKDRLLKSEDRISIFPHIGGG
jgi:molybdopterin converting factor small subunit